MATPNLVDLDFDDIREELKTFMQNQNEFTDYDFDGSGLSVLLDVLSYNTQMNAMMAHLVLNESFLNTAQVRANVVSGAQLLGYVPRSQTSAMVQLDVVVTGTGLSPSSLTIPRGYTFSGKINNTTYAFVVLSSVTVSKSATNTYPFTNLPVYQGTLKSERYNVDGLDTYQKFELNSTTIDTSRLEVTVFENAADTVGNSYTRYSDIAESGPDSLVWFLQENVFGRYDVYFGDGFIGNKPTSGSIVEVSYIETAGVAGNNITSLSADGSLSGLSDIAVSFSSGYIATSGGAEAENLESVRYNAPIVNATQDRAVTANDYATLLLTNFTELADVSVWGGEQASPPIYGKVYITPSLKTGSLPTQALKEGMISYLSTKNIGAILPEIVDPEYTSIQLDVGIKYDENKTTKTVGELEALIRAEVTNYNALFLQTFGGVLRHSQLLTTLDNTDDGVISSTIKPTLYKMFTPNPTQNSSYTILYPSKIFLHGDDDFSLDSTEFVIDGITAKIGDEPITGSTTVRRVFFYDALTEVKLPSYTDVGTVDGTTGIVQINSIKFDTANTITIYVIPDAFDIAPKFNQLLQIIPADVSVTMSKDSISANGQSGVTDFETFSRL